MTPEHLKKQLESGRNPSRGQTPRNEASSTRMTMSPLTRDGSSARVTSSGPLLTSNSRGHDVDMPQVISIQRRQDQVQQIIPIPPPPPSPTPKTSFPTKLRLLLRGAYRRVSPSSHELNAASFSEVYQPISAPPSSTVGSGLRKGPNHAQSHAVYTTVPMGGNNGIVTNNNNNGVGGQALTDLCPDRTRSVESYEETCRICHDAGKPDETFITPCACKGTMGLVHQNCLERWLAESGKSSCEICNYEYHIRRTPKFTGFRSIWNWIRSPCNPDDPNNLYFDLTCFIVLTPLAALSAYLSILGAHQYFFTAHESYRLEKHFQLISEDDAWKRSYRYRHQLQEESGNSTTWNSVGLLILTAILFLAYYVWIHAAFEYQYRIWNDWQRKHFRVTVLPYPPGVKPEAQSEGQVEDGAGGPNQTGTDGHGGGKSTAEDRIDIQQREEGQVEGEGASSKTPSIKNDDKNNDKNQNRIYSNACDGTPINNI